VEQGDLHAIDQAVSEGFPVLRRIGRNAAKHGIEHRVVFGFSLQTAPKLMDFLRRHRSDLGHATGIRYSGELGHPFHVIDELTVVLPLDHPFVPEGRFASIILAVPRGWFGETVGWVLPPARPRAGSASGKGSPRERANRDTRPASPPEIRSPRTGRCRSRNDREPPSTGPSATTPRGRCSDSARWSPGCCCRR